MKTPLSKKFPSVLGFTLLELLIVIAILGILSVGIVTAINVIGNLNKASLARAKTFSASVENALSINQVGKWSFEDGVGSTTFKDTSGWDNNGSCSGASCPTWKTASECDLGYGGCLSFDGDDDYVNVDAHASAIPSGTNNVTVTAWVKWDVVTPTTNDVIVAYGGNDTNQGFLLQYEPNQKMQFSVLGVGWASSAITPVADRWYHLVGIYDHLEVL